jgi:dynamin GTPase
VCDTIVTTVPKSVVHCLVRKAEKNLLNHLFGHVHKLSEAELKRMLEVRRLAGWLVVVSA